MKHTILSWNILYYCGIYYIIGEYTIIIGQYTILLRDILYYCTMYSTVGEYTVLLGNIILYDGGTHYNYWAIYYIVAEYTILLVSINIIGVYAILLLEGTRETLINYIYIIVEHTI